MVAEVFIAFVTHPIVLSCFFGWFIAQFAKFVIGIIKHRKFIPQLWVQLGGMPSAHSAVVAGLAASVYFLEGISTAFLVSLILAVIVIRDAMGVRMVVEELSKKVDALSSHPMHRRVGHTPMQVTVGVIIGILVAAFVHYI